MQYFLITISKHYNQIAEIKIITIKLSFFYILQQYSIITVYLYYN